MRKFNAMKSVLGALAGAAAMVWLTASVLGQAPVISSFGKNGELVCTNLQPGSTASVKCASFVLGPWTNSSPGLDAVMADTNGTIRVNVPLLSVSGSMFYRVLGTPLSTNPPAPAGMVLIPAGPFTMGDTLDGDTYAQPVHTVQVSAFYMDKYEVTKALWDEVREWANTNGYDLGTIGSGKASNHPVQMVNWYDVVKWCNARSEKAGLVPAYYTDAAQVTPYRTGQTNVQNDWVKWNVGFRLPTEAEWEKAARGGASSQRFSWGNTISWSQANYYANPAAFPYDVNSTNGYHPAFDDGVSPYTSPVGYFSPSGYGLCDMAGNVVEWCWDWYGLYESAPQTDPRGAASGSHRVVRGGVWYGDASYCRSAQRGGYYPTYQYYGFVGFRPVLAPGW